MWPHYSVAMDSGHIALHLLKAWSPWLEAKVNSSNLSAPPREGCEDGVDAMSVEILGKDFSFPSLTHVGNYSLSRPSVETPPSQKFRDHTNGISGSEAKCTPASQQHVWMTPGFLSQDRFPWHKPKDNAWCGTTLWLLVADWFPQWEGWKAPGPGIQPRGQVFYLGNQWGRENTIPEDCQPDVALFRRQGIMNQIYSVSH